MLFRSSNQSRGKRKTSNRYSTSGTTGNVEASASSGKTGKTGRNNPGKTSRKRKKAKWPVILLSLLVVLCVYGGWSFLHRATGYWNIAVFGVDSRDGNTKNALADVQLICSINQETGEIKLVSVYRDTYLKIDSKGTYHKINEAYFKGCASISSTLMPYFFKLTRPFSSTMPSASSISACFPAPPKTNSAASSPLEFTTR